MRRCVLLVLTGVTFALLDTTACGDNECGDKLTKLCKPNGADCICALHCSVSTDCLDEQYCDTTHSTCVPLAWACPPDGLLVLNGRRCMGGSQSMDSGIKD